MFSEVLTGALKRDPSGLSVCSAEARKQPEPACKMKGWFLAGRCGSMWRRGVLLRHQSRGHVKMCGLQLTYTEKAVLFIFSK